MSTPVTYNGNSYNIPAYQDTGYAQGTGNLSSYLIALATGSLTLAGGNFTLTADANFGASFGLISIYYKSRSAGISTAGVLRLANTDTIGWRNNGGTGNILLAANATATGSPVYTLPDVGGSSNFVMTLGAQTIGGAKTFTSQVLVPAGTNVAPGIAVGEVGTGLYLLAAASLVVTLGGTASFQFDGTQFFSLHQINIAAATNQINFGPVGSPHTTLTVPLPASNRVVTIPDGGADSSVVLTESNQTINGTKTFGSKITGTITGHSDADLALAGGTMAGNITMNSNRILGLPVPTQQKFLSGSGTYTTPANCLYIRVLMVGGGGGGAGSGTAAGTAATAGGNTTFGTTLLVANGGGKGNWGNNSDAGGSASLGTGPIGIALQGGTGQGSSGVGTAGSTNGVAGGDGAPSPFGGAGGGGTLTVGSNAAIVNSGSGGGGAATNTGTSAYTGGGGSAGGYVDAIITSPAANYSYAVGAKGNAGGAGTTGTAGGDGGSGFILVTEYYQ